MMQRRPRDAPPELLCAAQRLEQFDRRAARDTYRDAFIAAVIAGRLAGDTGLPEVAAAIRSAAPSTDPPSATDELLDALASAHRRWLGPGGRWSTRARPAAFHPAPTQGSSSCLGFSSPAMCLCGFGMRSCWMRSAAGH